MDLRTHERSDCWQLRLCALALSVCSFGVFLFLEVAPQHDPTFLAIGTLMVAWIGPLTLLAGTLSPMTKKTFKWWQPFEGGFRFVCMQAFGWSMIGLFLALCLVMMVNFHTIVQFEGQFLLLGIVAFIAQALLNLSIDQFEISENSSIVQRSFRPGWTKALVSVLVSISGFIFFAVYDSKIFNDAWILLPLGGLQFALSAVLLHLFVGTWEIPGYRVWQPFEGGSVFLLLQFIGWSFFTCMCVSTACLLSQPNDSYGIAICTGLLGLFSQILLLSSLYCFKTSQLNEYPKRWSYMQIPEEGFLSGIFVVFACILTTFICHLPPFLSHFTIVDNNTRLLGIVCLIVLATATPVAHCGGYRSVPEYRLWQPFVGESKFVFLQCMGWLWYGIQLGVTLLILLNDDAFLQAVLPFASALGTMAALTISLSMPFFHATLSCTTPSNPSSIWTGEYVLSLLLLFGTILLHLIVDLLHLSGRIAFVSLALGLLASCISVSIVHSMGGRWYSTYSFWQPFYGGDAYVLRQALGWTFFSIFALFDCVALGAMWNGIYVVPGLLLALSIYGFVPHIVLVTSLTKFEPNATEPATSIIWKPLRMSMLASASLNLGSFSLFLCAEIFRDEAKWSFVSELLFVIATIVAVIGISCTHCICGPQLHTGYRLFQPLRGGIRFVVYQGVGWTLAVIAWVASCTVIYWNSPVPGVVGAIGMMFFVAQLVLLGSLYCFQIDGGDTQTRQRQHYVALDKQNNPVNFLGPILGMVSCAAFAVVDMVLLRYGAVMLAFPMTICAAFALCSSIPLTFHFSTKGRMVYQVLGYTLWSLTMLLAAVFTYNVWCVRLDHQWLGVMTGTIGFLAHFVLIYSLSPTSNAHPEHVPSLLLPGSGITVAFAMWLWEDSLLSLETIVNSLLKPMHSVYVASCLSVLVITLLLHRWIIFMTKRQYTFRRRVINHPTLDLPTEVLHHLCEFLSVNDLAQFASCSKSHHEVLFTSSVWHHIYIKRRAECYDASSNPWSSVKMIKPTSLFSDTLCVRVERSLLRWFCDWEFVAHTRVLPPNMAALATSKNTWKVIAFITAQGGALYHCELCRRYEVYTPKQKQYEYEHACAEHQTSSWIMACCDCLDPVTLTQKMAHRACIEFSNRPICSTHSQTLQLGYRPPKTLLELTKTTAIDASYLLSCLKILLLFIAILQYFGFGWKAPSMYIWLLNTTLLSTVLHSTRFDQCVRLIWMDVWAFPLYLRLYYTLSCSSFLVLLWCSPLWSVSSLSWILQSMFVLNMGFYTILSTLTLFLFWKTQFGVPTAASKCPPTTEEVLPLRARCTLCRLHLCSTSPHIQST
ncbi:hypothetical protein THRCLA_09267 [Thraustotheca clavata]|uniref:F-box domain-containing protein n=1 Tax=Thraustotheca clavata TaxID=74557 RepID=A0A1V9YXU9_9STRA|nr:hypothetical protein THRCLA_09267 [Thraustotheca clavata]